MAQYDVDLRDYWRIFQKRKAIVILMVLLAGISSYGFAKLKEPVPVYEAAASVKIERFTNLADFLTGGFWAQGDNMVTQAFIITSFPVLVETAKELSWLSEGLTLSEIRGSKESMAVVERLKSMASAEQEEGTNIVNIKIVSRDPVEAEKVANAFARAYRNYNIEEKNRQLFETKAFIESQLEIMSRNLNQAENEVREFEEANKIVALDAQTANLLARISSLETEYDREKRAKSEIQALLMNMTQAKVSFGDLEEYFTPAVKGSPVEGLGIQLRELVLKRESLLFEYTDKHPLVIAVTDNIETIFIEMEKELKALLKNHQRRSKELQTTLANLNVQSRQIPEKALQLSRLKRELTSQEELYSQLKAKYQETLIKTSGRIEEVSVLRPAVIPSAPINIPSKVMIIFTGLVMGLIIGVVFTFVAETLDTSIGTIEDVESLLGVPVLGVIPYWEREQRGGSGRSGSSRSRMDDLVTHFDPKSLAAEAFRTLRTNLQFMSVDSRGKSFLVTSSFVQEGKTSNVVNLALSMAQAGDKVLLIEGDLRKPLIHKMYGIDKTPGLTDYVLGNYNWKEIVVSITDLMLGLFQIEDILRTPGLDNLNIITAGTNPPNPSEILRSPKFRDLLKEAYQEYDFIFIDAPPVLPVADATEISTLTDGVILVYKVGAIARGILNRAKQSLDNVNAKVLGIILNNVKPEMGPDYFKYHAHYYYGPPKEVPESSGAFFKKYFKYILIVTALSLVLLGILWK